MKKIALIILCLALGFNTSFAKDKETYLKYDDFHTPKGFKNSKRSGTYKKDPHIWVYTSSFAKRFGMPKRWIDDSLKGAQAIAFRYDYDVYGITCGLFGDIDKCSPSTACVVDLYIKDSTNLPWNNDVRFNSIYGYKSKVFMRNQTKGDTPRYLKRRNRYKRGAWGWQYEGLGLSSTWNRHKTGSLGKYNIFEYDRDIYDDLDYTSGSVNCGFPKYKGMRIDIINLTYFKDGRPDYGTARKESYKGTNIAHTVFFPDFYMDRVKEHSIKMKESNKLLNELKKKLSSNKSKKEKDK